MIGHVRKLLDIARAVTVRPAHPIVHSVRRAGLTYLDLPALNDLYRFALKAPPGLIIEAGCAMGGSSMVLATTGRRLRVYDVFGMIPPPGDRDGDDVHERYRLIASGRASGLRGARYYGYQPELLQTIRSNFERHALHADFIPGLFEDTLVLDEPVAFAHIDADWFDSVLVCLERIAPRLCPGGRMVVDDYDHWSGARRAVDQFLAGHPELETERRARLHIVKPGLL